MGTRRPNTYVCFVCCALEMYVVVLVVVVVVVVVEY